jgi:hypothetical protein
VQEASQRLEGPRLLLCRGTAPAELSRTSSIPDLAVDIARATDTHQDKTSR